MIRLLLVFITFFFLDNLLVLMLPIQPIVTHYQVIPNLFLTCLVMFVFFEKSNRPYYLAIIFGILYDIFYAGIFGLYPILFTAAVFTVKRFFVGTTPINLFSMLSLLLGVMAATEWIVYFLVLTMTDLRMTFMHFAQFVLFPTLLFNTVFIFVAYPILISQFRKYKKSQGQ